MNYKIQAAIGIVFFLFLAFVLSSDKRNIQVRYILSGLIFQFIIAVLVLKVKVIQHVFHSLNQAIVALQQATEQGTSFVFGYLGGGPVPFDVPQELAAHKFILVFQALPLMIVVSALSSLLFYWKVIPLIIKSISKVLEKTLGIGGALGLGSASSVFFGMDVTPLLIKPHLKHMTRSELFSLITCGMATVASAVMLVYVQILKPLFPDAGYILGHIISASLINVPSALIISRIMMPQLGHNTGGHLTQGEKVSGFMDAISKGVNDGVGILVNITAMLLVLTSLVYLANQVIGAILPEVNNTKLTLQGIFGLIFSPFMWFMGIPWSEINLAGSLMGTKLVLNEIFAYKEFAISASSLSDHSKLIMLYGLCGFANFGSVGITIGALGTLIPERHTEVVSLGLKSLVSGTIATCLTATIIGLLT